MKYIFGSIGTQLNDNYEEKIGIILIIIFCSFHSLIIRSTILTKTHKCSLRNENDILDNPIPCKLTLLVYSIWNIKYKYDPKYAPQYISMHTNYIKLSKLVL